MWIDNLKIVILSYGLFLISCVADTSRNAPVLSEILSSSHPNIKQVMDSLDKYAVQIIYSEIKQDASGHVTIEDQAFHVDNNNYFYPASSVKFPIAFLALEKLHHTDRITSHTSYTIEGDTVVNTIRKDIQKIFAVSDNQAYNRLFEFLGTDYINAKLKSKGLFPCRISHRLSVSNADDPMTKRMTFHISPSDSLVIDSYGNQKPVHLKLNHVQKGVGYYQSDSLVNQPFDFSLKNYLPITVLHNMMKSVFFPTTIDESMRLDMSNDDLTYLKECMHTLPQEAGYDPTTFYDSYVKFFMFGDSQDKMPNHIKIYNKVGYAYGHLVDTAYIVDEKENISFILSATILVNDNQIYNDDHYEYDSVGIPFLAQLGREVHQALVTYHNQSKMK